MSFQLIRAHIEERVNNAFQAIVPAVPVVFDNTAETPPERPYVVCLISYTDTTLPVVCQDESMVENINGNLQLSIYGDRGRGMGVLEVYAAEGMKVMNHLYEPNALVKVKCGQINGPVPLLDGDEPYALVTLSCPFVASVPGNSPGGLIKMYTDEVST